LARYAIERFLYRLSQSPYADQFVLKGAMLLQMWLPEAGRPTRDGETLVAAVYDTFDRRKTAIPSGLPTALTPVFVQYPSKAQQWQAFLTKSSLHHITEDLATITDFIAHFLGPVLNAARDGAVFSMTWPPGGPWQTGRNN